MNIKRTLPMYLSIMAALVAFALVPTQGWAQVVPEEEHHAAPGEGLEGTAHDFSGATAVTNPDGTVTGGVGACTFCHTPHRAYSTQLLWNHTLSTNSFKWDVAETTAGTDFPEFVGNIYNGVSAKCLSCHDGSVAIGDVAWWDAGKPLAPLDTTTHGASDKFNVGLGGNMKGNHPVAMPYPFGGAGGTYNQITTGPNIISSEWVQDPQANGIRLFIDTGTQKVAGGSVGATGIECSSCHDPHNKSTVKDHYFLRGTLTGNEGGADGYICLKCHIK